MSQLPPAEMITVPGAITSPSLYFCFIERESLPVGILIPNSIAKSEQAFTASYNLASSPSFLQAHIQFAESDTLFKPSLSGAQTKLERDSPIAIRLPAAASINAETGA
ncbi:hypothetical protein D3C72_1647420 [compost metagenome]